MPTPASVSALIRRSPTIVRLPDRAFISVSGPQASAFLHGILSTAVHDPPRPFFSSFLSAQGRVLYDVFVHTPAPAGTATPSTSAIRHPSYVIEYDPSALQRSPETPPLLSLLKRFVLRAKVRVQDVTPEYDVWAAWGNAKPEVRHWKWAGSGVGEPVWDGEEDSEWPWRGSDAGALRDRRAVGMGTRRIVPKGVRPQESSTHDEASPDDYLLHRIAHGVAEGAIDIPSTQAFPMESNLDLMGGIDFHKGCYVGQELTVRTYHTGLVRKRILPVLLQSSCARLPTFPNSITHPHVDIRASPTHPPAEGRIPRPRGTGRLLSNIHGIGLALLRLEHVDGAARGDLQLQITSDVQGGQESTESIYVIPWRPSGWPVPEALETESQVSGNLPQYVP
ncbi:hypothetical protein K488DRAFT_41088 [Vararia minispora EC-137]|uniref:Uncharacterized protein n=1 Tax=Vararia minispora EC-137 TaxID=1314806 RepID=A0ACB8QY81_9AGAM|nr:hypothetical protein K488DRAFT_41088 [Vararia minispora EC-137]